MLEGYTRVNECPICGKKRCLVSDDGKWSVCLRLTEGAHHLGKRGFGVYLLNGDTKPKGTPVKQREDKPVDFDYWHRWNSIARLRYVDTGMKLGKVLGLSEKSLGRLGIGVLGKRELQEMNTACKGMYAYTFPMCNEHGRIIGLRLRSRDGFKYCCDGSRTGVFIPADLSTNHLTHLHVVEGPTDTAAALDLGVEAIGRPMNVGLTDLLANTIRRIQPAWVTIIIDRDKPGSPAYKATWRGAKELKEAIKELDSDIIYPPGNFKDVREALIHGNRLATRSKR